MTEKYPDAVKRDQVDPGACGKALQGILHHQDRTLVSSLQSECEQTQHKQVEDGEYAFSFYISFPWTTEEQVKWECNDNNEKKFWYIVKQCSNPFYIRFETAARCVEFGNQYILAYSACGHKRVIYVAALKNENFSQ